MTAAVNVDGCKRALDDYLKGLEEAASASIDDALEAAQAGALSAIQATTKRHTGTLESGLTTVKISPFRGKLFDVAPYAKFIDEGTKPHTIRAKNTKFLRFVVGGTVMFRRSVNHPGTAPRPFISLAQAAGQMALRDGLQRRADILAENFNR